MNDEASYICDACGEEIVVPIDLSQGTSQDYVEDCPVCCHASLIHVEIDEDARAEYWTTIRSRPDRIDETSYRSGASTRTGGKWMRNERRVRGARDA